MIYKPSNYNNKIFIRGVYTDLDIPLYTSIRVYIGKHRYMKKPYTSICRYLVVCAYAKVTMVPTSPGLAAHAPAIGHARRSDRTQHHCSTKYVLSVFCVCLKLMGTLGMVCACGCVRLCVRENVRMLVACELSTPADDRLQQDCLTKHVLLSVYACMCT